MLYSKIEKSLRKIQPQLLRCKISVHQTWLVLVSAFSA